MPTPDEELPLLDAILLATSGGPPVAECYRCGARYYARWKVGTLCTTSECYARQVRLAAGPSY